MRWVTHAWQRESVAPLADDPVPFKRDDGSPITIENCQRNECRWIVDEVCPAQICGHPTHKDSSWCLHHYRRAFPRVA